MSDSIEFSAEQAMLLDTAQDFCRERAPIALVREHIAEVETYDAAVWQEMADLGWMSIAVPESQGGLGMGLSSVVPVVECMGQYLLPSPYLATTLAIHAIATSGNSTQQQRWLPALAAGQVGTVALTERDGNWLLTDLECTGRPVEGAVRLAGTKCFVMDGAAAELVVVSAQLGGRPALIVVEREQIPEAAWQREIVIDETRRSYQLCLDEITVNESQCLAAADFLSLEQGALLLVCAEISGGMRGCLRTIVEYLNTRKQFDRYIGSYQALKHPAVDILLAEEAARSHVYHAATLLAAGDLRAFDTAVRIGKAHGSAAFAHAADRAIQFHGGFGFTYECDAQLFLRRALWCQHFFGDERHHRQILAPTLLDES